MLHIQKAGPLTMYHLYNLVSLFCTYFGSNCVVILVSFVCTLVSYICSLISLNFIIHIDRATLRLDGYLIDKTEFSCSFFGFSYCRFCEVIPFFIPDWSYCIMIQCSLLLQYSTLHVASFQAWAELESIVELRLILSKSMCFTVNDR